MLSCWLISPTLIGLDNQATIKALSDQSHKPSQYLLNHIRDTAEKLQEKQDKLHNIVEYHRAKRSRTPIIAKTHSVVDLKIQWVPGHVDFMPNEKVDANAKRAAKGDSSPVNLLPKPLRKTLPYSISTICQVRRLLIYHRWVHRWKMSLRYPRIQSIDKSTPTKKWLQLILGLSWAQASLILQLCTNCVLLNKYLHCIKQANSPACPNCPQTSQETTHHFLFECSSYRKECFVMQNDLGHQASNLTYLPTHSTVTSLLLKYICTTHRLRWTFGELKENK